MSGWFNLDLVYDCLDRQQIFHRRSLDQFLDFFVIAALPRINVNLLKAVDYLRLHSRVAIEHQRKHLLGQRFYALQVRVHRYCAYNFYELEHVCH
jgi:hypothetical protein